MKTSNAALLSAVGAFLFLSSSLPAYAATFNVKDPAYLPSPLRWGPP